MARSLAITVLTTVALALSCAAAGAQGGAAGYCADIDEVWREVFSRLTSAMDDFAALKDQALDAEIDAELKNGQRRRTIARAVQRALGKHGERRADGQRTLETLAAEEKASYERLKACLSRDRTRRRGRSEAGGPERERARARLNALLADEAFLQYKGQKEYGPTDYSATQPRTVPQYSERRPETTSPYGRDQGWFGRR